MGIQTSHAGSLPRPDHLIELNRRRMEGEGIDEDGYAQELHDATVDVVKRQTELGITLPNDGEYGHAMGQKVDYGSWWSYIFTRLGGLGHMTAMDEIQAAPPTSTITLGTFAERRDWNRFADAYGDPDSGVAAKSKSGKGDGERVNSGAASRGQAWRAGTVRSEEHSDEDGRAGPHAPRERSERKHHSP